MSLLIVGTVAFDKIETPLGKSDKILGGAGTYIGIAASYFTDKTNIVSVIGDDFPDGLTLLHVELVLFAHLVSVIYEFVFVFRNVKNIFFSSYLPGLNHISTLVL